MIMSNELWLGASIHSGDRAFFVPDDYPLDAAGCGIDEATGRKYIRVKGVRWFTNLDIKQRHEDLILVKQYDPDYYRRFDNYGAIIVDSVADIPCDYSDVMGVSITFLDKYNPGQFDIIGRTGNIEWATTECTFFTPPSEEMQNKYKKQTPKATVKIKRAAAKQIVDGSMEAIKEKESLGIQEEETLSASEIQQEIARIGKAGRIGAVLDDLHGLLIIRTPFQSSVTLLAAVHCTEKVCGVICQLLTRLCVRFSDNNQGCTSPRRT